MKALVAQGGKSSCKEAAVQTIWEDDQDDDPTASKDGKLPSSSTKLGMQVTIQGESSKLIKDSSTDKGIEKEAVDLEEEIEALFGINDVMIESDLEDELEEGVFIPKDVVDWRSDEEIMTDREKEAVIGDQMKRL